MMRLNKISAADCTECIVGYTIIGETFAVETPAKNLILKEAPADESARMGVTPRPSIDSAGKDLRDSQDLSDLVPSQSQQLARTINSTSMLMHSQPI